MDKEKQQEIYDIWKLLENDESAQIRVKEYIPVKRIEPQNLDFQKMLDLTKYRKWVLAYCLDIMDSSEKHEILAHIDKPIECVCTGSNCAKCLLVNCKDDDCYFHLKETKEESKRRYNSR
ncbi:MAG: hypothetical protein WAV09_00485 [Minisyncoccia bacterium]